MNHKIVLTKKINQSINFLHKYQQFSSHCSHLKLKINIKKKKFQIFIRKIANKKWLIKLSQGGEKKWKIK